MKRASSQSGLKRWAWRIKVVPLSFSHHFCSIAVWTRQPGVSLWHVPFFLSVYWPVFLSYPSFNFHFTTVHIKAQFKYSRSPHFEFRTKWAETTLSSHRKTDSCVATPVIRTVVLSCSNPGDSLLLHCFSEKACIKCLTLSVISALSMNWIAVDHGHMFLKWRMHKDESVLAELVVNWYLSTLFTEPLDLIPSNAVTTNLTHTFPLSVFQEPDPWHFSFQIWGENRYVVGKHVLHRAVEVFEVFARVTHFNHILV